MLGILRDKTMGDKLVYVPNDDFEQGGRGHWAVCFLHPKFYFNVFLFFGLTTFGTITKFNLQRGYFVYHHWENKFIGDCLIPLDP